MNRAYEEIIDWLAGGFTPADLVSYRPSAAVRERVADLSAGKRVRRYRPPMQRSWRITKLMRVN